MSLRRLRWLAATMLFPCVILLAGTGAYSPVAGQHVSSEDSTARAMSARITDLRYEGRFADAAAIAGDLLSLRRKQAGARSYLVTGAERQVRTLVLCAQLPAPAQSELAAAYRSWNEIESLMEAREFEAAVPKLPPMRNAFGHYLGTTSAEFAQSISYEAEIAQGMGHYEEADSLYRHALGIYEVTLGENDPRVAAELSHLAWNTMDRGEGDGVEQLLLRALHIQEASLGPDDARVASTLVNLNMYYFGEGRFADAEPLLRRALSIQEKTLGPDHPRVGRTCVNLGVLYSVMGRREEAAAAYTRGIEVQEKAYGPDSPTLLLGLQNLAGIYAQANRAAEAESLYVRAIHIIASENPDHPDLAPVYKDLGTLCTGQRRFAQADSLLQRSAKISAETWGLSSPAYSQSQEAIGNMRWAQGKLREAQAVFESALQIDSVYPDSHPDVVTLLHDIAGVQREQGLHAAAIATALRAWRGDHGDFRFNSIGMVEHDALRYAWGLRSSAELLLSALMDSTSAIESGAAAEVILGSKGVVSEVMYARRRLSSRSQSPEVVHLRKRLAAVIDQRAMLFAQGPAESGDGYRELVDSLGREARDLEIQIGRMVDAQVDGARDVHELLASQSLLPPGTALVEYLKYARLSRGYGATSADGYLALVMRPGRQPMVVDLGDAGAVEGAIGRYRSYFASTDRSLRAYRLASGDVHALVWKPLESMLAGYEEICVSPDGALNQVSFAGLMTDDDRFIIEGHVLRYLSAGRDIARVAPRGFGGRGLLAFGNPDFDSAAHTRATPATPPDAAAGDVALLRAGCGDFNRMRWNPLPGTESEIRAIKKQWSRVSKEPVELRSGAEASEEFLKSSAGGYRVLHIATHGYFLGGKCMPDNGGAPVSSPLLLSGFLLAGANRHGKDEVVRGADGIVTADEVAGMDLAGTEAVVLSGCETGLGAIENGEGVYGLRRAFVAAGARSVISALWAVPDRVTASLMGRLYGPGEESFSSRLRAAQLEWIRRVRTRGDFADPYDWAAFCCVEAVQPGNP